MNKNQLKEKQKELLERHAELQREIDDIDEQLFHIEKMQRPYVAAIESYSSHGQMAYATEAAARRKLDEYFGKTYFRNGLSYGAYLYKHNEDGSRTLIENRPMSRADFYPAGFERDTTELEV